MMVLSLVLVLVFFLASPRPVSAQERVSKVEFGPVLTTEIDLTWALGGCVTLNPHRKIGFDLELNYFPDAFGGNATTGLFGVKLTPFRRNRVALFGKVRPGFARLNATVFGFNFSLTKFALDYGGGVEVFLSKHVGVRVDLGPFHVRDLGQVYFVSPRVTFRF
jgi:hypothetical protein